MLPPELLDKQPPVGRRILFPAFNIFPVHQPRSANLLCRQLTASEPVVNRAPVLPGGGCYGLW
jgi:hypothetical protein